MPGPHDHFVRHPEGGKFFSVCGYCGDRSERGLLKVEIDDWEYKHEHELRTPKGGRASLSTSVKWYWEKVDDTRYSPRERKLWKQLAEEAERHLRQKSEEIPGQISLFD